MSCLIIWWYSDFANDFELISMFYLNLINGLIAVLGLINVFKIINWSNQKHANYCQPYQYPDNIFMNIIESLEYNKCHQGTNRAQWN